APEAEIVADDDQWRPQLLRQQSRERFAGKAAERRAEPQQPQEIASQTLEGPPPFATGSQASRHLAPGKQELPRHRLERQHHDGPGKAPAMLPQPREQRLVAQVHAIEGADRDDGAPVAVVQAIESANELHEAAKPLMSKG